MIYPKVIVLTLNYNGKPLLKECIESYLANDYPNFKMVLIDNGSKDGSEEYVKTNFSDVTCIQTGKNLGYSGGFNVGLKYTFEDLKADYALVTNNDVKADKGLISALVDAAMVDSYRGFVTGKVYYYDKPDVLQTVGKSEHPIRWNGDHIGSREIDHGQYDKPTERAFIDDIFTLVSAKLYNDTGGYDTTFFLQAEEYDWQARAKKLGYKMYYTPLAKLWHKESMTLGKKSTLKAYYDARNPLIVIMKHRSKNFYRSYLKWHLWNVVAKPSFKTMIRDLDFYKAWMMWKGLYSATDWKRKNESICFKETAKNERIVYGPR